MFQLGVYRVSSVEKAGDGWHVNVRVPGFADWKKTFWTDDTAIREVCQQSAQMFFDVEIKSHDRHRGWPYVLSVKVLS